jgi:hypothetical protein
LIHIKIRKVRKKMLEKKIYDAQKKKKKKRKVFEPNKNRTLLSFYSSDMSHSTSEQPFSES